MTKAMTATPHPQPSEGHCKLPKCVCAQEMVNSLRPTGCENWVYPTTAPAPTGDSEAGKLADRIEADIFDASDKNTGRSLFVTDAERSQIVTALRAQPPQPTGDVGELVEPDFYADKSDLDVARHINLSLLMCNGISEQDAGFDMVVSLNDAGLEKIAGIVGRVRESTARSLISRLNKAELTVREFAATADAQRRRAEVAEQSLRTANEKLAEIVHAYDNGGVQMASPEIGGHDDIPPHPWHEEWLHGARALTGAGEEKR